jgi:alcohol dehydrogenase
MYPREAAGRMAGMIQSGVLDIGHYHVTAFNLDQANEAIAHAARCAGPFNTTVICP